MTQPDLKDRLTSRLTVIDREFDSALVARAASLSNIRWLAQEGAWLEGERVVLSQVLKAVEHHEGEATPEQVLWSAVYGAATGPASSHIDAEAFAEGQRNALRWVRLNVRRTEAA